MVAKAVESADGFVAHSRLHAKLSRRTSWRIMWIHKECMYPSRVKDVKVKLLTAGALEDGGVLGVVPEWYQGSGLSPDR